MAPGNDFALLNDRRRIGYAIYGAQEGRPVMFFTGTPGSRLDGQVGDADAVAEPRGIRLIVVERPGYGLSDRKPGRRVVDWANDVRQVADHLELERFAAYGYSGGGPHALACAARLGDRVSAVAAVSGVGVPGVPAGFEGMGPNERLLHRLTRISPRLVDLACRLVRRNAQRNPDRFFPDFEKDCTASDRELLADASIRAAFRATVLEALDRGVGGAVDDWVAIGRYPWGFAPEEIRSPVALFFGDADRIVPVAHGRDPRSANPARTRPRGAARRSPVDDRPARRDPRRARNRRQQRRKDRDRAVITGRCLCGGVSYSADAEPVVQAVCHCADCQRQTGSPFTAFVGVPRAAFRIEGATLASFSTTGEDHGRDTERNFCSRCGAPIFSVSPLAPEVVFIKAGSLDDASWLEPTMELWTSSAQPWSPRFSHAVQMKRGPQ